MSIQMLRLLAERKKINDRIRKIQKDENCAKNQKLVGLCFMKKGMYDPSIESDSWECLKVLKLDYESGRCVCLMFGVNEMGSIFVFSEHENCDPTDCAYKKISENKFNTMWGKIADHLNSR